MAGLKATGLFLLGSLAGFGVALLVFVARLLSPIWPFLYISSINAFLTGIVLVIVEVRRRTREFWALTIQHRTQATVLSAQYQTARFDPRVHKEQATDLLRL